MFDIVLFQPEIPPNTGNLIRLAANTGCRLHLVEPHALVANPGMEEHDGQPLALFQAGQRGAADLNGKGLGRHDSHCSSAAQKVISSCSPNQHPSWPSTGTKRPSSSGRRPGCGSAAIR